MRGRRGGQWLFARPLDDVEADASRRSEEVVSAKAGRGTDDGNRSGATCDSAPKPRLREDALVLGDGLVIKLLLLAKRPFGFVVVANASDARAFL